MKTSSSLFFVAMALLMAACGGSSRQQEFRKTPVDQLIIELDPEPTYSIVLYDMDVTGNFNKHYLHKYKVIREKDSIPYTDITDWQEVPKRYFEAHVDDLGMELVAKAEDGTLNKTPAPEGYTNYVGNPRYGSWETNSRGETFWSFYGKYMLLNQVLGSTFHRPVYRRDYTTYRRDYYGRRSYYGGRSSGAGPLYGTNSSYQKQARPDFFERRRSKNNWNRSSSRNTASRNTSSNRYSNRRNSSRNSYSNRSSSRTSRSSSRYGNSNSRRRSGGYGK